MVQAILSHDDYAIAAAKELIEKGIPTFGICLGHQIIGFGIGRKNFEDEVWSSRR